MALWKNRNVFQSTGSSYCLLGRRPDWIYWKGAAATYAEGYLGLRTVRCGLDRQRYVGVCSGFVKSPSSPADPYAIGGQKGSYAWNTNWALPNEGRGALLFRAAAKNDIHVGFSDKPETRSAIYEVVIGGWGNTKSACRRSAQGAAFAENATTIPGGLGSRPLVSAVGVGGTTEWWVSVDRNAKAIRVGRGAVVGQQVALECRDPSFLTNVRYFSFSSWDSPIKYSEIRTIEAP